METKKYNGPNIVPDSIKMLDNQEKLLRKIDYLEQRLNQNSIKLNDNLSKNKQLRNKIDQIRKERVVYDKIYRELEYDMMKAKDAFKKSIQDQYISKQQRNTSLE